MLAQHGQITMNVLCTFKNLEKNVLILEKNLKNLR